MRNLLISIILALLGRNGVDMMAFLYAQQIMLGKKTFAQIPAKLKEQVKEILIDSGCENLVAE